MTVDLRPLIESVLERYGIDDEPARVVLRTMTGPRECAARELLARAGEAPRQLYVIARGLVRYYYLGPDGKEWNKAFFREGQVAGSLTAYLTGGALPFSIECVEPCLLLGAPYAEVHRLQAQLPAFDLAIRRYTEELFLRNERREAILLTGNAEQRYRWLCEQEPWLLERAPQYELASYLGMDAVSLSRVKARLQRQDASRA